MTETPDLLALRDGLPAGPWTYDTTVMPGHFGVYDATNRTVARTEEEEMAKRVAAIPSMLEEIERLKAFGEAEAARYLAKCSECARLRALVENKNEACLLAIAEVERLHGIITELREALAAMVDAWDMSGDEGRYRRIWDSARAILDRDLPTAADVRGILKTETAP